MEVRYPRSAPKASSSSLLLKLGVHPAFAKCVVKATADVTLTGCVPEVFWQPGPNGNTTRTFTGWADFARLALEAHGLPEHILGDVNRIPQLGHIGNLIASIAESANPTEDMLRRPRELAASLVAAATAAEEMVDVAERAIASLRTPAEPAAPEEPPVEPPPTEAEPPAEPTPPPSTPEPSPASPPSPAVPPPPQPLDSNPA